MNNEDTPTTPNPEEKTPEILTTDPTPITPPTTPLATPPSVPPEQSKKSKKGLIISLVVVLVLIIGVLVAYFLFFKPSTPKTETPSANTPSQNNTDYSKALIAKVKSDQKALDPESTKLVIEDSGTDTYPQDSPLYKLQPDQYYMSGKFGAGFSVGDKNPDYSVDSPNRATVVETLNKTFSADTTLKKSTKTWERSGTNTIYQNDTVICDFYDSYPVHVSCANKADYDSLAKELEPFANALFAAIGEKGKATSILSEPTITTKDGGYANAWINVGIVDGYGRVELFYGKDGDWTYWRGTQNTLQCDYYNTYALQASFKGDTCYDNDSETERKVEVTL